MVGGLCLPACRSLHRGLLADADAGRNDVTRFASVQRCLCLPRNTRGRDFVVGDLHGHRALLERELARLSFDTRCDRLLSVGDLIDRGPDSLASLSLIDEPWFHAVLGNHELMLVNYLFAYGSRLYSRKSYASGPGAWAVAAMAGHRKAFERLTERLTSLPLSIHVDAEVPFFVTHADLPSSGLCRAEAASDRMICVHRAEKIASSRRKVAAALRAGTTDLRFGPQRVHVSDTPFVRAPITYAGHSPMHAVTVHESFVYIDQGVCSRTSAHTPPTLLDHGRFARWLVGVATARRCVLPAPARWPLGCVSADAAALA